MSWPLSHEFNESIQNPQICFNDPDLKTSNAVVGAQGFPLPRSGNFADVYQVKGSDGRDWAVKCFTRHVFGLGERYAQVSDALAKANLPFAVGFTFLAEGIRVNGVWRPIVKMEWVEGLLLNHVVRENAGRPQILTALNQMWVKLCKRLRDAGVAHADLQHGNVLLVPGSRQGAYGLKLIDYDGMYVPALAHKPPGESGHPSYQHPSRAASRVYSPDVDRFPHLVVATALKGLEVVGQPLWDRYDNGDNLLFTEADYRNPSVSKVMRELWQTENPSVQALVGRLAIACIRPIPQTPWLDQLAPEGEPEPLDDVTRKEAAAVLGVPYWHRGRAKEPLMPDSNDPSLIIDPRLGSLMVSASGHLDTLAPSASGGAPLDFGPPAAAGEVGTLGPYRVVKELGRGGMGAVFLAVDTRLDRRLALKVMLPEFAANAEARERFLREARAAAKIGHDNVVTVFEADERDGIPYIAMQLLQGYPLDAFLQKKGTPSLRNVLRITRETSLGLAAAHKLGVVHRDVKPANLWLESPHGRVKLLDFGLARPEGLDTELTRTGVLIGTPAFMSPEQALGERVDHRTDLYSLGAVLYWLCTGQLPFQASSVVAMLKALTTEEPKPVLTLNPRLPGPLAELIHQLLAKTPERRPQSAAEVANRLHGIMEQSAGLSPAMPGGGSDPAGSQAEDADPWTTLARSATSQQAGGTPPAPSEPKVLRSMRVVAITPMTQPGEEQKEPQEPATGEMRTVISSGILWEEGGEGTAEAKRPNRPKRRVKAEEEEEEQRETEAERPYRPTRRTTKRMAKGKNASPMPLFIGIGAVGLIVATVAVTLLVAGGRQKPTETVQQKAEEQEPARAPANPLKGSDNTPPKSKEKNPEPVIPKPKDDPIPVVPKPKDPEPDPVIPKLKDRGPIGQLALKKRWTVELGPDFQRHSNLVCSADSRAMVVVNDSSITKSLDAATGRVLWDNLKTIPGGAIPIAMAGSRLSALKTNAREGVQVIDAQTGNVTNVPAFLLVDGLAIASVSPDGRYLSAGRRNSEPTPFKVQRIEDGKFILDINWAHGTNILYTADSSRILVVEFSGRGRWYKLPSGELDLEWEINVKKERPKFVSPLGLFAGSSDGSVLLFDGTLADRAGEFHLIDGRTGRAIRSFSGNYALQYGSLSADGRIAVLAKILDPKDKNRTIHEADVIDTTTGDVVAELKLPGSDFIPTVLPDGSGMVIRTKGTNASVTRYDFIPAAAP